MIPYYIIMGIIAYLIGSINFSILISKKPWKKNKLSTELLDA